MAGYATSHRAQLGNLGSARLVRLVGTTEVLRKPEKHSFLEEVVDPLREPDGADGNPPKSYYEVSNVY